MRAKSPCLSLLKVVYAFLYMLRFLFALSLFVPLSLYPSEGKEDEGRADKAYIEVQVKITTPDLS